MKYFKSIIFTVALAATSIAFLSCGGDATNTENQGKEYTSAYICPMHCEGSGSDKAGTCPDCKMDYVANEDHKADGHKH